MVPDEGWGSGPESNREPRPLPNLSSSTEHQDPHGMRCPPDNIRSRERISMRPQVPDFALSRRAFLGRYAGGLGSLALAHLAAAEARAAERNPLALKKPHHEPKAKAVICLFQHGGPSQMDLFDPKPELTKQHGKPHPGKLEIHFHTQAGKLLGSPFKFQRHGKSGIELSELLPQTGKIVDEMTLIR